VPHFHFHVLPRHPNVGVNVTWPVKNPPADALAALASRLKVPGSTEHRPTGIATAP
jgi:histidine triad (HIT) family protein